MHLEEALLAKNNKLAELNRNNFQARRTLALNLMSAPGAGKTALLERTLRELDPAWKSYVIEGDQETTLDALRLKAVGAPVVQINTGAGCHLDAEMVSAATTELAPAEDAVVFIENVGNLVCPALFDLGEQAKVVLLSVTEGDDKPLKYPHALRASELLLITKVDLLPYVPFDVVRCMENARRVNPKLKIIALSSLRGDGMDAWHDWLRTKALDARAHPAPTTTSRAAAQS